MYPDDDTTSTVFEVVGRQAGGQVGRYLGNEVAFLVAIGATGDETSQTLATSKEHCTLEAPLLLSEQCKLTGYQRHITAIKRHRGGPGDQQDQRLDQPNKQKG